MITVLSLACMVVLGVAILAATSILYASSHGEESDIARRGLAGVSVTFIIMGIVGFVAMMTLWLSCPLLLFGLFALVVAWIRFIRVGREELLRILAIAAEKGIPLSYAASAFAAERPGHLDPPVGRLITLLLGGRLSFAFRGFVAVQSDRLGRQASRLATLLDGGTSLTESVNQSLNGLSTATLVAVRMGEPLGNFGSALSQSLGTNRSAEAMVRTFVERFMYYYFLFVAMQFPVTFSMIKIIPVYEKMFREYDLRLPTVTLLFIYFAGWYFKYAAFIVIAIVMGTGCVAIIYYLGLLPRNLPGLSRLLFPYDRTQVLRVLGWSVRAGKPMTATLDLIADQYPRNLVQRRITRAGRLLHEGRDWCDSLRATRFLKTADVAVLRAAERAGNLAWALETLADSHLRRIVFRLRTISMILFPCLTILLGAFVGWFCLTMFLPLVDLITKLS